MRFLEREGMWGALVISIALCTSLLLGVYAVSAAFAVLFLCWFYIFSSKPVIPSYSGGLVAPISGIIRRVDVGDHFVRLHLESRRNGRIYAPADFFVSSVEKRNGFLFFRNSAYADKFRSVETIRGDAVLNGCALRLCMSIRPLLFRACGFGALHGSVLFLDRLGFLNFGTLLIDISYDDVHVFNRCLSLNVDRGSVVSAGVTEILTASRDLS